MRLDPLAQDTNAGNALYGGETASVAFGIPTRSSAPTRPLAGLRAPSGAVARAARIMGETVASALAPAATAPSEPSVGYNPQDNTIFSQGKIFDMGNLSEIDQADKAGYLRVDNRQLPPGFTRVAGSMVRQNLERMGAERGFGSAAYEVGRQAIGGLAVDVPAMLAKTAAWNAPAGSTVEDLSGRAAAGIEKLGSGLNPDTYGRGEVANALGAGARALGPSGLGMAGTIAGGLAGGPAGYAAGAAATGAVFGSAQAWDTYQRALAAGKTQDEARAIAQTTGLYEGAGEVVGTAAGAPLVRGVGRVAGLLMHGGGEAGKLAALRSGKWVGGAAADIGANAAVQAGTEYGQGYAITDAERGAGISTEDPHEAGMHGFKAGLGMSALLGPLAVFGGRRAGNQRAAIEAALQDESAPAALRMDAAKLRAQQFESIIGKERADAWLRNFAWQENIRAADLLNRKTPEQWLAEQEAAEAARYTMPGSVSAEESFFPPPTPEPLPMSSGILGDVSLPGIPGIGETLGSAPPDATVEPASMTDRAAAIGQARFAQQDVDEAEFGRMMDPEKMSQFPQGPQEPQGVPTGSPVAGLDWDTFMAGSDTWADAPGAAPAPTVKAKPAATVKKNPPVAGKPAVAATSTPEEKSSGDFLDEKDVQDELNKLEASSKTQPGKVKGRVTLPAAVLRATTIGILNNNTPRIRTRTGDTDQKATEDNADQMNGMRHSVARIQTLASSYYDNLLNMIPSPTRGANIKKRKGLTDEDIAAEKAEEVAEEMRATRVALRGEMEKLVSFAGSAANANALIAVIKRMIHSKSTTTAERVSLDTLVSRSWKDYVDGVLDAPKNLAAVRSGPIRDPLETKKKLAGVSYESKLEEIAASGYTRRPLLQKRGESDKAFRARRDAVLAKNTGLIALTAYLQRHGTPFEMMLSAALNKAFEAASTRPKLEWTTGGSRYDPKTDTVYLSKEESPEVILHEALHAALQWFVYKHPNHAAVLKLQVALKRVLAHDPATLSGAAREVYDILVKLDKGKTTKLDAVLELISYGSTLREFNVALTKMKGEPDGGGFLKAVSDLWKRFAALVEEFLGVRETVANDVLNATMNLLEAATQEGASKPAKGKGATLNMIDTATAAFKKWFGESTILKRDGTPKLMYHGTARDITEFKPKQSGAIFLTDNPKFAEDFADMSMDYVLTHLHEMFSYDQIRQAKEEAVEALRKKYATSNVLGTRKWRADSELKKMIEQVQDNTPTGEAYDAFRDALRDQLPSGPNIMPLYVRAENPFDYENADHVERLERALIQKYSDQEYIVKDGWVRLTKWNGAIEDVVVKITNLKSEIRYGNWALIESREAQGIIKGLGYDGFYVTEGGTRNLAVYSPNQVKSATGNEGTFDGSGNILKAEVESAEPGTLYAAVQSFNPVMSAQPGVVATPALQEYNKKRLPEMPTKYLFDMMGYGKVPAAVKGGADKAAAYIREHLPGLTRWTTFVNNNFLIPIPLRKFTEDYKPDRNAGYQMTELLVNDILARPAKEVLDIVAYLDGDKTKLPAGNTRELADDVLKWRQLYIDALRNPRAKKYFETRKFSESLIFAKDVSQVASRSLGARKLNDLGSQKTQEDLPGVVLTDLDARGNPDYDGNFIELEEKGVNGEWVHSGFISEAQFKKGMIPAGERPNHAYVWTHTGKGTQTKGTQKFTAYRTAQQAIAEDRVEDVANALRNTMATLAGAFASNKLTDALAEKGTKDEMAKEGLSGVVFDSVDDLNAYLGPNNKVNPDSILSLSSSEAKTQRVQGVYRSQYQWILIPKGETYGALAGKLVQGGLWGSIQDMTDRSPVHTIELIHMAMRTFKKTKTTMNPRTHVANVATNVSLSILHDIPMHTVGKAIQLMWQYSTNPNKMNPEERRLVHAFMNSGAMLGDFSSIEVKKALHDMLIKAAKDNEPGVLKNVLGWIRLEAAKRKWTANTLAALGTGKDAVVKAEKFTTQLYAAEDNAFRLAAFLKEAGRIATEKGVSKLTEEQFRQVGNYARYAFLNYDIDARAVKLMRASFIPFVSWTYAVIPVLGKIALEKPWKVVNLLLAYTAIQEAMRFATGDDGEEDEKKRASGPGQFRSRLFGYGPYTYVRIPFFGTDEKPMFFKLGAYIPLGNYFDPSPNGFMGMTYWPSAISPTGPMVGIPLALIGNVDPYTGKQLSPPTDSDLEHLWNVSKFAIGQFTPPVPGANPAENKKFMDILKGKKGPLGHESSDLQIARWMGLQVFDLDIAEGKVSQNRAVMAIRAEFAKEISKIRRAENRFENPDYEGFEKRKLELRDRMLERIKEARGED